MQNARRHFRLTILAVALVALASAGAPAGPPAVPARTSAAPAAQIRITALSYTVQSGDNLNRICSQLRERTGHYSLDDMLTAVRGANDLQTNLLRPGQVLLIPAASQTATARVLHTVAEGAEVRGIYLTGPACGVSSVLQRVDRFIAAGGNTVVFDAKDIDGAVSYRSTEPLAGWGQGRDAPVIPSLGAMLEHFHRRGLYVVARLAVFLDGELGGRRPDLALQGPDGAAWSERGCVWLDPSQPEVRRYHLALATELAQAGVDEIQLDYVRFPTNGWRSDWQGDLERTAVRRQGLIAAFLTAARDTLRPTGVKLSADLFGIMGWERTEDLALTGQHVPTVAALVDVVCPMIYPSHFAPGFEGRKHPADDPAWIIAEGTRRFRELVGPAVEVRPWLQAFPWRVTNFDGHYIVEQVIAARREGAAGWCLWNPASQYEAALSVLPSLCVPLPAAVTALHTSSAGRSTGR